MKKYYRIKEAADLLNLDPSQIYRLIQQNRIRIAGKRPLRVTLGALRQWLRGRYPCIDIIFSH